MPRAHGVIAEGFGRGIVNLANQYAARKTEERERSRVKDLLGKLENASDIEKVQIYGEIDPKLAMGYQIANEKNKIKQQNQQIIQQAYGGEANLAPEEAPQKSGSNKTTWDEGPPQQQTQAVTEQGTETQPGVSFKPNAPSMAARNATQNQGAPFSKDFMGRQLAQPGTPPNQQMPQEQAIAPPPQQQLTPQQQVQKLRAEGTYLNGLQPGAGKGKFDQAKGIEADIIANKKLDQTNRKLAQGDRDYAASTNKDFHAEYAGLSKTLPQAEFLLNAAEQAVQSGELGPLSLANLAKRTGIHELNSPEGSIAEAAIKGGLIGNISKVAAKGLNVYLEKVAMDAYIKTGESTANNQVKLEVARAEVELGKLKKDAYQQVLDSDLEQFGAEQPFLARRADKLMEAQQKEITNRSSYKIKRVLESAKGPQKLAKDWNKPVPKGTPLTPEMGMIILNQVGDPNLMVQRAKQLGYNILSAEQIEAYE